MAYIQDIRTSARVQDEEQRGATILQKYRRFLAWLRRPLFLYIFVIPNLAAALYFGVIASPVFVSRASLMVVNPSSGATLNALISGGSGDSISGAYLFQNYAGSWEAFQKLNARIGLAHSFRQGDFVSAYGRLATGFHDNDLALWKYYARHVEVDVDDKSGIASIAVLGYRAGFAQTLLRALLADAERHFEEMTQARQQELLDRSADRAAVLERSLRRDDAALAGYRAKTGSYDQKEHYLSLLSLLNNLAGKKSELESQYASVHAATPNSPDADNLRTALGALNARIAATKEDAGALEKSSAVYDSLVRKRDNDAAMLQQINLTIQEARLKTNQDRYYFNIISAPSAPATAEYPRALLWMGGILLASLVLWGLLR